MHNGLVRKDLCSGCAACAAVCSQGAIAMMPDAEGFRYPVVNIEKCVWCGLCQKSCPSLHPGAERVPLRVCAARAKDEDVRQISSSGGIFTLLARQTFTRSGIVYGAAIRTSDLMVAHQSAETEAELASLRGSKYVQSDVGDLYEKAKRQVIAGRQILFSGTPCQIAAFRRVLGREYENLLCIEVICHAVPSPVAWERYLQNRIERQTVGLVSARAEGPIVKEVSFRRKNCGWKRYSVSLSFTNGTEYLADLRTDFFLRGFLAELYNRPSCHRCTQRGLRSGADITLGDFWKVDQKIEGMDDDRGTSLVLIHTERGERAFEFVKEQCRLVNSNFEDACWSNSALTRSSQAHVQRDKFFRLVCSGVEFDRAVNSCLRLPLKIRFRCWVGKAFRKVGLRK